jgi:ergothioneine biosynthesis protein EgtB
MMDLLSAYNVTRKQSENLCRPLENEDYVPQSTYFTSPPKWNLAHTSWFFEEFILKNFMTEYSYYHPLYPYLFNSYYEGAGERTSRNERGALSRPTVKEIYAYRAHVDEHMEQLLKQDIKDEIRELVILGMNHEQQHQELFYTDHKYNLSRNPLYPVYSEIAFAEKAEMPAEKWIRNESGLYEIGDKGEEFSFDNEKPRHTVYLQEYEISNRLVTNREYIEFIESGAYSDFKHWHEEGYKWICDNKKEHPLYWQKKQDGWYQYTLAGLRKIPESAPVTHINYYEAFAFASWKGKRLPTEFEWEAAADKFHWGDRWEWTESAYLPYSGYKKAPGTVGEYNGKFMVNQKVLRGSSVVTPKGHERKSYRNIFHPHLSWQFTGIRLAK